MRDRPAEYRPPIVPDYSHVPIVAKAVVVLAVATMILLSFLGGVLVGVLYG